ncbi:MAG: hypothetical protein HQM13_11080 [SAR324 cluster bacterium]|nr:hypothetical protein [SAR324 cluster bacterium]
MKQLKIGRHTLDLNLISYVDLNYKVEGGVSRVLLGLAKDMECLKNSQLDRLFFGDREAEQLRRFFQHPENSQEHVVVFSS